MHGANTAARQMRDHSWLTRPTLKTLFGTSPSHLREGNQAKPIDGSASKLDHMRSSGTEAAIPPANKKPPPSLAGAR